MGQALRARGPVRHADADDVPGADRVRRQVGHERAVDAAGEPDDYALEPAAALHLIADELDQPAPGEVGVDGERVAGGIGAHGGGGERGARGGRAGVDRRTRRGVTLSGAKGPRLG